MNHKRGRPRKQRAGCLWCKWHKHNGAKDTGSALTRQERRAQDGERASRIDSAYDTAIARPTPTPTPSTRVQDLRWQG